MPFGHSVYAATCHLLQGRQIAQTASPPARLLRPWQQQDQKWGHSHEEVPVRVGQQFGQSGKGKRQILADFRKIQFSVEQAKLAGAERVLCGEPLLLPVPQPKGVLRVICSAQ